MNPTLAMGIFQRLIRTDQPESTKRAIAILAAVTLCACTFGLTLAVEWQAASFEHRVDGQLVLALIGLAGSVAGLAGVAYRKQDPTAPGGPDA